MIMDEVLAERIRIMRMEKGMSWRRIAMEVEGIENQIIGRDLCFEAEEELCLYFDSNQED
jgi:hypothetical protein